jgi:tetratricopeptide (TPR) repeat protein
MARRGLHNDAAAILLAAYMDRRQGNWEKAIQDFNEAIARDPRNPESISELGDTFFFTRQFRAAEEAYDRLIELVPDKPMLKVARADYIAKQGGDAAPVRTCSGSRHRWTTILVSSVGGSGLLCTIVIGSGRRKSSIR